MSIKTNQKEVSNNLSDISIVDFVKYIISYWLWFLSAMIVFGFLFGLKSAYQEYTYSSQVTLFMNDPNQKTSVDLELYGLSNRKQTISMAKEKLMFKSLSTLEETVKNSKVNVSYTYKKDFRNIELYTSAPFEVVPNSYDYYLTFYAKQSDDDGILLSKTPNGKFQKVFYGTEISIDGKAFTVKRNSDFTWPAKNMIKITVTPTDVLKYVYQSKIVFTQNEKSIAILSLSINDNNKDKCTAFLNELVKGYNRKALSIQNTVSVNTSSFIEKRLGVINGQLQDLENNMQSYLVENNGMDYTTTSKSLLDKMNQFNQEIIETNTNISLLEYLKEYVTDKNNKNNYIPINTGINNEELIRLIQKYNDLKLNKSKLLDPISGGGSDNPIIKEIDNNIKLTEKNIITLIDNIISGLKFNISKIDKYVDDITKEMEGIPSKEKEYLTLKRLQNIKEGLYVSLLNKMEENSLSQAVQVDNATIVDIGDGPSGHIAPNMTKSVILGAIVGFIVVAFVLFLIKFFDTKIHTAEDIEKILDAPILGLIPFDSEKGLIKLSDNDLKSESFRLLRSNLYFMNKKNVCNRIITNSIGENSGKTYNASNLARTIAFAGQKILLIDLDIRKGTLSRLFKVDHLDGITNYLIDDDISVENITYKDPETENLYIIPCGDKAPNPAELLMDDKLDELIDKLSTQYDYIIMDNVPIDAVSDPFIVNRLANITLFIIRAGKLEKKALKYISKLKEENKLKNLAIVLNGVKKKYQQYGYGNYSYGYTYGNKKKKSLLSKILRR